MFSPHPVLPSLLLPRDLANRLVTSFWLRNDRVTRRLKTSKPQGLTRHLVHTPTRHCLLFLLHTSTLHLLLFLPCLPFTSHGSYTPDRPDAIVFPPPGTRGVLLSLLGGRTTTYVPLNFPPFLRFRLSKFPNSDHSEIVPSSRSDFIPSSPVNPANKFPSVAVHVCVG